MCMSAWNSFRRSAAMFVSQTVQCHGLQFCWAHTMLEFRPDITEGDYFNEGIERVTGAPLRRNLIPKFWPGPLCTLVKGGSNLLNGGRFTVRSRDCCRCKLVVTISQLCPVADFLIACSIAGPRALMDSLDAYVAATGRNVTVLPPGKIFAYDWHRVRIHTSPGRKNCNSTNMPQHMVSLCQACYGLYARLLCRSVVSCARLLLVIAVGFLLHCMLQLLSAA